MTKIFNFALKIKGGGREGGTCEVLLPCHPPKIWNVHTGMCHYFGYFFGVAPGFLGTFFGLFPDFWVSFFGYSRIFGYHFLAIPGFLGIIFW